MNKMMRVVFVVFILGVLDGLHAASPRAATGKDSAYTFYLKALIEESRGNVLGALAELKKAVALSPDTPVLYRTGAELSFRLGDADQASDMIEKAISLDPSNVKLHILAGQIYWALGDMETSQKMLTRALELGPDEAEALVSLAVAVTPTDPKRAISLYGDYLQRHPNDVEIQERIAQLHQSMGAIPEAKKAWARALELSPSSLRAHLASAQIAEVELDTATAIAHYYSVLEFDPTNLPLILRIGELRYRNNEMAEAREAFSSALSIAPTSTSANFWLALIAESKNDWPEAIRLIEVVAAQSSDPGILLRLAYYNAQAGRQKESIRVLENLTKDDPENVDFLNYLAMALEQDNQYAKAVGVVEKIIAIDSENAEVWFHAATLYDRLNKFPKAEEALKKTIALKPDHAAALNYLGYSYADRNIKLDEAEPMLNQAVALDPLNAAFLDSIGWLHYRQGRFESAEQFLKQSSELAADPLIFSHLGDVQWARGRALDALRSYAQSLRVKPNQKDIQKTMSRLKKKLSDVERAEFYFENAGINMSAIASYSGMVSVESCAGRSCLPLKGQFSYEADVELRLHVPGPLGAPALLVVKSATSAVQFGAFHPVFQAAEPQVAMMAERVYSVLSYTLGYSTAAFLQEAAVHKRRNALVMETTRLSLIFSESTGRLLEIRWTSMGQVDSLKIDWPKPFGFPEPFARLTWADPQSNSTLRLSFQAPIVTKRVKPHHAR